MKKMIYKIRGVNFLASLIFCVLLCFCSPILNAQQKISISPLSATDTSSSTVSEMVYGRDWSEPMMTKSDKLEENSEDIRRLSASTLLHFEHYDIEGSKSFLADEYPDIFSYPGIVPNPLQCELYLSNLVDDMIKCYKKALNVDYSGFVEDGFAPKDSRSVGRTASGLINETPVIADINSDDVVWPYLTEPYAGEGIEDRTYPATIGIDPIMFTFDMLGEFFVNLLRTFGNDMGLPEFINMLDIEPDLSYDLVGFNATEFGDDILIPVYNTMAAVGPFTLATIGDPSSSSLPKFYFSPIATFRKDADTGRIKLNGYADSFNMSYKKTWDALAATPFGPATINAIPNAVDLAVVFVCLKALEPKNLGFGTDGGLNGLSTIYPYYSTFADFGAVGNEWDMPKVCSLSLLRYASYMHSNPTDVVVYKDNVVVINQMPVLRTGEIMAFGRPVLLKNGSEYKSTTWGEYLGLGEDYDLWSSAVIYKCKESSIRSGYFNDDCEMKGFTLIPANSYNATAVENGILVATPGGIYYFDPSVDFPNVGYLDHQNLSNKSIPIAKKIEVKRDDGSVLDVPGTVVPYGIKEGSLSGQSYVAITYRMFGEESLEDHPIRWILKDKRIFSEAGFADFVAVCKYGVTGDGAEGELTGCDTIQNGSIKSSIVDADLKDIDDDGFIDIAFTDLVLGGMDDESNFYRSHVCYRLNPADCQEVKMANLSGGVGLGPKKIEQVHKYMKDEPEYLGTSKIVAGKGIISAIFGGRPPMVPNGGCSGGEKDDPIFSPIGNMITSIQRMAYNSEQNPSVWYSHYQTAATAACPNCTSADITKYHAYPVAPILENSMCTQMNTCKMTVKEKNYEIPLWGDGTTTLLEKTSNIGSTLAKPLSYEYCCQSYICEKTGPYDVSSAKYGWCFKMLCNRGEAYDPAPQVMDFCEAVKTAWNPGGECNPNGFSIQPGFDGRITRDDLVFERDLSGAELPSPVPTVENKPVFSKSAQVNNVVVADSFVQKDIVQEDGLFKALNIFSGKQAMTQEDFASFVGFIQTSMQDDLVNPNLNGVVLPTELSGGVRMISMSTPGAPLTPTTDLSHKLKRYKMPPGIPMDGKFQISTVLLNKETRDSSSGVGEKECVTEGYSSNYMKSVVESIRLDAKEAWGVVTGAGELGYSTVKCRAKIADANDEYIIGYTKGPLPINFVAMTEYPETIKMLDKAVTIAPLDASYTVKSVSGNKGSNTGFDISQSTLVSIPASVSSLSSEMTLDINRLSDDVGIVINNHIGHTVLSPTAAEKANGTDDSTIVHEIFVNVIDPCAGWTARGGGGDKCPAPEMNVSQLKSEGKWDERYVYVFKIVNGTKGGIEEDEIRIIGVDSALFGRGGGCACDVNAKQPSVYEIIFGMLMIVILGSGFVFARQRTKRK